MVPQMIPLELVPLYRKDTAPFQSWPEPHNHTEWSLNIRELTQAGNEIARLMLQNLGRELAGSHIGKRTDPFHSLRKSHISSLSYRSI